MAVGDIYELVLQGTALGEAIWNVQHYKVLVDGGVPNGSSALIQAWSTANVTAWLAARPAEYALANIAAKRIKPTVSDPTEAVPTLNLGTRVGVILPTLAAVVLSLRTGIADRSHRGRKYFGPLVEADVTDNALNAVGRTNWVTASQMYIANVTGGGFTFENALYSRLLGTADAITGIILRDTIFTERLRLRGRGI